MSSSTSPDAVSTLNAWLALEALQPQIFSAQNKLLGGEASHGGRRRRTKIPPRLLAPFDLESNVMPWEQPVGDRVFLGLGEKDSIRWWIPIGFIQVKPAVDRLIQEMEPDGPERETTGGVAVLALAAFNEKGHPVEGGFVLSSFGWACGQVLAGRIGELHQFVDIEKEACRSLAEAMEERGPDGVRKPTGKRGFIAGMTALMQLTDLPKDLLERPRYAIRIIGESDKEPLDIINSFLLRDLDRVRTALKAGDIGRALSAYLGQTPPEGRRDVLTDKTLLDRLTAPRRAPPGRWPAPKPAKLATLQQAAVNAAALELADGGLLSINGPPGTGKTTLLRDVLAAVIVERALALAQFDDPAAAFSPIEVVAENGLHLKLHRLDPRLRGFGVVVASSNNAAVRNVSAELPLRDAIAADVGVRHFPGVADTVLGKADGCWGLAAAVLGNRSNRAEFVENVWWHPDWGLEKYFSAAAKGAGVRGASDGKADEAPPKIIDAEQPPTRALAREVWRRARLDYREKREAVEVMAEQREQLRYRLGSSAADRQALDNAENELAAALANAEAAEQTSRVTQAALTRAEAALDDARALMRAAEALRPGVFGRLLGRDAQWRERQEEAAAALRRAIANRDAAEREATDAARRLAETNLTTAIATGKRDAAAAALAALQQLEAALPEADRACIAGPAFWSGDHAAIHAASPWADDAFVAARDALFAAAMSLHRAFIDAAATAMRANLSLMMNHLKGRRIPSGADVHLSELWDSFFLLVPLASTTFASFDRLMEGMGKESIGWLIVDEAGQATPQAAVGAVWRARRALIIGDPLQIEPVSVIPTGLIRTVCAAYDVHPDLWAAPRASAQTLADVASPLMTRLDSGGGLREIGMPLLVHRRCQEPMFSISNEIAYGGLMVHAVPRTPSPIAEALADSLPQSAWIDVMSNKEKWAAEEGDVVVHLLARLGNAGLEHPNVYVITPFREVAERLRAYIADSGVLETLGVGKTEAKRWCEQRVGTVHTFQGKEAEAVFLVLGASSPDKRGARNWAGGTPNILNVAATRAKKALYVIGRRDVWENAGVFAAAARRLPRAPWPVEAGSPSL